MKIGISAFAAKNMPDLEAQEKLISQINSAWEKRKPGAGRDNLDKVVLVPIPTAGYFDRSVGITEDMLLEAWPTRREEGEDLYVAVRAVGYKPTGLRWLLWKIGLASPKPIELEPAQSVKAVLYSADTLLENNGKRTGDFDWEVVAVVSGADHEPMEPVTMARNYLGKPGGTPAPYTIEQTMNSIYHWSGRAKV